MFRRPDPRSSSAAGEVARERGTVTAETAVAMPAVVLVLSAVLSTGQAVVAQVRCIDAARAAARLSARGEPAVRPVAEARRLAPAGSVVAVADTDAEVTVRVSATVRLPLGLAIPVSAVAVADRERS